jgi:hypothetical protein
MSLDDVIKDGPISESVKVVDGRVDVDMYHGPLEEPGKGTHFAKVAAEIARLEEMDVELTSNAEYVDGLLS